MLNDQKLTTYDSYRTLVQLPAHHVFNNEFECQACEFVNTIFELVLNTADCKACGLENEEARAIIKENIDSTSMEVEEDEFICLKCCTKNVFQEHELDSAECKKCAYPNAETIMKIKANIDTFYLSYSTKFFENLDLMVNHHMGACKTFMQGYKRHGIDFPDPPYDYKQNYP